MSRSFERIQRRKAGIPISHAIAFIVRSFIDHIETMAGRTKISADPAAQTFLVDPVPKWAFHHEV
jgi:hypothetical protein